MTPINLPLAELKPALAGLGKVISRRATLPVLGMIKIDRTRDGWITLTTTDLDHFITVRLEEPVQGDAASILVPYEDLNALAKAAGKGEVFSVEKAADDKAIIAYSISEQLAQEHVLSAPADDFPPLPRIKTVAALLSSAVRDSLHQALRCASTDEARISLNGAYLDVSDARCHQVVATDGRHLYSSNSFKLALKESVLVQSHRFLGWKEFSADGEWQIRVQAPERKDDPAWLQLSSRRWRYIAKQIDGNFPNWRQCVPKPDAYRREIRFDQIDALIQTIERLPDGDSLNHSLTVQVAAGKVYLIANTADKPVRVEVGSASAEGGDGLIGLNREYLVQALRFGLTRLQVIDEMSPVRLSDDAGRQMIVMPIRLSGTPKPPAETAPTSADSATPTQERTPMQATNGNGHQPHETRPALEAAVEHVEAAKASLRTARESLNQLLDCLKTAQREQRNTSREVQSVRTTLEKLQTVRL